MINRKTSVIILFNKTFKTLSVILEKLQEKPELDYIKILKNEILTLQRSARRNQTSGSKYA